MCARVSWNKLCKILFSARAEARTQAGGNIAFHLVSLYNPCVAQLSYLPLVSVSRPRAQYEWRIVCGFQICDEIPRQLPRHTTRLYSRFETRAYFHSNNVFDFSLFWSVQLISATQCIIQTPLVTRFVGTRGNENESSGGKGTGRNTSANTSVFRE